MVDMGRIVKYKNQGFTVTELLIVIVVIAILVAISIMAYGNVQDDARATAIASGIRSTEDAMVLALTNSGATKWWSDDDYLDEDGESSVSALIAGTNLKDYMSEVPKVNGSAEDDSFWMYDNDGPEDEDDGHDPDYNPDICPQSHRSGGVNLQIELHNNLRLARKIDEILDDGNLDCGKFREHHSNDGEFMWLLSPSWRKI